MIRNRNLACLDGKRLTTRRVPTLLDHPPQSAASDRTDCDFSNPDSSMNTPSEYVDARGVLTKRAGTSQFIAFEVDGRRYAFRIEQIREIVILKDITLTPQVPHFVDGVSNLRGAIIPIINLRALFGMPRKEADSETRTIVLRVGERTIGCTVDTVTQVLRIAHDQIQTAPDTVTAGGAHYIDGFATVADRLVIVLDVDRLLNVEQLNQVKQANLSGITSHGD